MSYFIQNSLPRGGASTWQRARSTSLPRAGEEEGVLVIEYGPKMPSGPDDVYDEGGQSFYLSGQPGTVGPYTLRISGEVDDYMKLEVAGKTLEAGPGDNVPFEMEIGDLPEGWYKVKIRHENSADVVPRWNESYLYCELRSSGGVIIDDDDDIEPDPNPDIGGPSGGGCGENGDNTADGGSDSGTQQLRSLGVRQLHWGDWASTSGGSRAQRAAGVLGIEWSVQFGVFRGMAYMPSGRLIISTQGGYSAELGTRAGLEWKHPLSAWLGVPEGGVQANDLVTLHDGAQVVNYMVDGLGLSMFPVGASRRATIQLAAVGHMSRQAEPCTVDQAAYIRASYPNGSASFFSVHTGQCLAFISRGAYELNSDNAEQYAAVVRESDGRIRQVWNTWDGLADMVDEADGGYSIRIYTPAQVQPPAEEGGLFSAVGDPVRVVRILASDAMQTLSISEYDATLPAADAVVHTSWEWADGAWSLIEGTGDEAVITRRRREDADATHYSLITEMLKGGSVASRVREEYENALSGQLLLKRIEGVDAQGQATAESLTTEYTYNKQGQLLSSSSPTEGTHYAVYDNQGRIAQSSKPWGEQASGQHTEYVTYQQGGIYSTRPTMKQESYSTLQSMHKPSRKLYSYTDTDALERVEIREQETYLNTSTKQIVVLSERLRVHESWQAGAPEPHAAGRLRMEQGTDGVQRLYSYAATTEFGALYSVTRESRVGGDLVPGQSERQVSYVSAEGNTLREENYALLGSGEWVQVSGASYEYDELNRLVQTHYDNGRSESRKLTCCGELLWEEDANGVRTSYSYNSARQLIETTRSAVYDGEECITPETITEYERDAAGRITRTTTRIGALTRSSSTVYDLLGRKVEYVDELGRVTRWAYTDGGRTTTETTPAGATIITTLNTDSSVASQGGTGQRPLVYSYDYDGGLRESVRLESGELITQTTSNSFGETTLQLQATTQEGTMVETHWQYNDKGQLTRYATGTLAPIAYEYDSMGHLAQQITLLDEAAGADPLRNPIELHSTAFQQIGSLIYSTIGTRRNNPEGEWLLSSRSSLVSQLSPTIESRHELTDERGHTTISQVLYGTGTQRIHTQQLPTSSIEARKISIDGFTVRSTDSTGITSHYMRSYRAEGLVLTDTDGRGNTTTTRTDIAERPIEVTNAAGDTTRTIYDPTSNNPAEIIDPQGNTLNYAYDERGRKVAEWGSGTRPATYAYNEADQLTALTTWRDGQQTISTDPRGLAGGDTTRWEYDAATGLELSCTYADGQGTRKSYDPQNRLAAEQNARGGYTFYSYHPQQGTLASISYTDPELTAPLSYEYNILGQPTRIVDAAGDHRIIYDSYGSPIAEDQSIAGSRYTLHETLDAYGRNIGYHITHESGTSGEDIVAASTAYAADGRISSAGILHAGEWRHYHYHYLPGSNLLERLVMPNGMELVQNFAEKRNLLTTMSYYRGSTLVVRRSYSYDDLGRPTARKTERRGGVMNETFSYNTRSELTHATRSRDSFAYAYDNAGNRLSASEMNTQQLYATNALNQYTQIDTNGTPFTPEFDADGNQIRICTTPGMNQEGSAEATWRVTYNGQNRAIRYESADGSTIITCGYDGMGRRYEKKVEQAGTLISHRRYLYRGYLVLAELDLTSSPASPQLVQSYLWDPTQPLATRPLALLQGSAWYSYGWDLTKNVTELFTATGQLDTDYVYTPYGAVRPAGNITQPLQWSSESYDSDLGLVYYNYRYYNPTDGRWTRRDPIGIEGGVNLYAYVNNYVFSSDRLGESYLDTDLSNLIIRLERRNKKHFNYQAETRILFPKSDRPNTNMIKKVGDMYCISFPEVAYAPEITLYWGAVVMQDDGLLIPINVVNEYNRKLPGYYSVLNHEKNHARITAENWRLFVNESLLLEKCYCSISCAVHAVNLTYYYFVMYQYMSDIENTLFDYGEYGKKIGGVILSEEIDALVSADLKAKTARNEIEKHLKLMSDQNCYE